MSTTSPIAALAAVAIVIAAPAFADQRAKPTPHRAVAGAFASSVNTEGAHVNPVQRRANNNLNPVSLLRPCLDFGIDLDAPTRCWGRSL
jgi:hypothetical protein